MFIQRCHLRCLASLKASNFLVSRCLQVVAVTVIVHWDGLPVCCDVYWLFHGWRHLRKGCWSVYVEYDLGITVLMWDLVGREWGPTLTEFTFIQLNKKNTPNFKFGKSCPQKFVVCLRLTCISARQKPPLAQGCTSVCVSPIYYTFWWKIPL